MRKQHDIHKKHNIRTGLSPMWLHPNHTNTKNKGDTKMKYPIQTYNKETEKAVQQNITKYAQTYNLNNMQKRLPLLRQWIGQPRR